MLKQSPDTCFLDWKVEETKELMQDLKSNIPFTQFLKTKRMVCSLGESYRYSGQVTQGHSFDCYPPLFDLMERLSDECNVKYNSILLNWYPKGTYCGIGSHSDNEPELVKGQRIASVSLGESCDFILSDKFSTEQKIVTLNDGDVFVMGAECQRYYKHEIKYKQMEEDRISLTFRRFKTDGEFRKIK